MAITNRYSIAAILYFSINFFILQGQNPVFNCNFSTDDPITIPTFFKGIISTYSQDFYKKDSISYIDFCKVNNLLPSDKDNFQNYYTFQILHMLFTCTSAFDCSKGQILDIPYFWHWIDPNPRFDIKFTSNGQYLKDTKPPSEFSRYRSFAEIDRTPLLFLSDLVSDSPKYFASDCDTFSTFGWCSEREMAFVALMSLLNFEGCVRVMGDHSCSYFLTSMKNTSDGLSFIKVFVENTFDQIQFRLLNPDELTKFRNELKNSKNIDWYNKMAHSKTELNKINTCKVSKKARQRIYSKISKYLAYK